MSPYLNDRCKGVHVIYHHAKALGYMEESDLLHIWVIDWKQYSFFVTAPFQKKKKKTKKEESDFYEVILIYFIVYTNFKLLYIFVT
jgi:hypothetical protein